MEPSTFSVTRLGLTASVLLIFVGFLPLLYPKMVQAACRHTQNYGCYNQANACHCGNLGNDLACRVETQIGYGNCNGGSCPGNEVCLLVDLWVGCGNICGGPDPEPSPDPGSSPPPPPQSCWAACTDSSQCQAGLTCTGGSCYSCDCDGSCGGPGDPPPPPPPPHNCNGQDCPDGSHCGANQMCAGPDSEGNYRCRGDPECNRCNSNGSCNSGEDCGNCPEDCCAGYVEGYVFDDDLASACTEATSNPIDSAQVSFTADVAVDKNGCSISGSDTTQGNGKYKRLLCEGTYKVSVTTADFLSQPSSYCPGLSTSIVTVTKGKTTQLDLGLTQVSGGWFQAKGSGNVRAEDIIQNLVPATCAGGCKPYVIDSPIKGDPGVLTFGASADLTGDVTKTNADVASEKKWLVNGNYGGKVYGYTFYLNQLGWPVPPQVDFTDTLSIKPTSVPKNGNAYYANGNLSISGSDWAVTNNEEIALLVDGNVTISNQIRVEKGGFLLVLASGNIAITPTVDSEADGLPALEGMYIADGTFSTGISDQKLILAGTFVGWTNVLLERDFSLNYEPGSPNGLGRAARNNTEPVEVFQYRPDLIKNAPTWLTKPRISWEEVAP